MKSILIKPLIILTFVVCPFQGLIAQKSGYFTYDRESVSQSMAQINEDNAIASPPGLVLMDTARSAARSNWRYYLLGIVTGSVGCTAGTLLPYLLNPEWTSYFYYLPIISGIFFGFLLPSALVEIITRNKDKTISTGLGNLTGFTLIIEVVLLYFIFSFAGN